MQEVRIYRRFAEKPQIRMDGDVPVCNACGKASVKSERFLYCSVSCRQSSSAKRSSSAMRQLAFERDRGVCAETGLDCHLLDRIRKNAHGTVKNFMLYPVEKRKGKKSYVVFKRRTPHEAMLILRRWQLLWNSKIIRLGIPERLWKSGALWEADHIIPVHRGGGSCDINNIQTLSFAAHLVKTNLEKKGRKLTGRHKMDKVLKR